MDRSIDRVGLLALSFRLLYVLVRWMDGLIDCMYVCMYVCVYDNTGDV